jgi:hypothetical protein
MTLLRDDQDYYDVTIINGLNLPLSVTPMSPTSKFLANPNTLPYYYCEAPGGVATDKVARPSSWRFEPPSSKYALVAGGSGAPCPCATAGEVCGTSMKLTAHGLPLSDVGSNVCGKLVGMWTDDELCAWTDAIKTYGNCKSKVPGSSNGGTYQQMFACDGAFAQSCFQKDATGDCCGCSVWPDLGIQKVMNCSAHSAPWTEFAEPRLQFLKAACPTCYTYPFDDSTSLFTCRSETASATSNNTNSYRMQWCPKNTLLSQKPVT